jgi:hypothetical protein
LALGPGPAAAAPPDTLTDGTVARHWRLANGLEVTTRHVPDARAVAMSLGFRVGGDHDPVDRDGLAILIGELLLTAPAGETPGRTRAALEGLRPEGWDLQTGARLTLLSEVVTPAQLAGSVRELAARLRGVTVTATELKAAQQTARAELADRYFGDPNRSLYYRARELALGGSDETMLRKADAKGLAKLTSRDVLERLRTAYVPANAVLSLVGDLSGTDVRALVESQFGAIPGGSPLPAGESRRLRPVSQFTLRPGIKNAFGILGVIAPAITDSTHPGFYLGVVLLGTLAKDAWGDPKPLSTRFQYSIFSDPDLALFYPEMRRRFPEPDELGAALDALSSRLLGTIVDASTYEDLRDNLAWQFGSPMSKRLLRRMQTESPALQTLAKATALRSLWMGEDFWAGYLERLNRELAGAYDRISTYVIDPAHQVRLVIRPT